MAVAKLDENSRPSLIAVSSIDPTVIVPLYADPVTHRLLVDSANSSGTVTSITQGTGILLTPSPIVTIGSVALATNLQPMATLTGNSLKVLRVNVGETAVEYATITNTPGGLNTQLQYNNSGVFAGISGAVTDGTAVSLTGAHLLNPTINGAGTGLATLAYPNTASNATITFPTVTGTLATLAGSEALTNKSLNGNTFTTGTYTLTGTAGKTLTFTNSITLSGTDSTVMTFPTTTATIARTDAAQTFTGTQTVSQLNLTANAIAASGNAATIPVTSGRNIVTNNSAATLTITMTTASAVNMQMCVVQILDASAVAQTITWINTENSSQSVPTTSNGSTTLPITVGFIYNSTTSKWRVVAVA